MEEVLICIMIFLAKILQLAASILKDVTSARGEKTLNIILCFFEVTIYIVTTGFVIAGIAEDIYRFVAYILGCGVGCYIGMILDEKIAVGKNMLTVIVSRKKGPELARLVREKGYAVTTLEGESAKKQEQLLLIATRRKKENKLVKYIFSYDKDAKIIDESVTTIGGYLS